MERPTPTAQPHDDALAGNWYLDASRSRVEFTARALWGLVPVRGVFHQLSGSAAVVADGQVSGTLTVKTASVDTKNARRDKHLRSADFFDCDNHPGIAFVADAIQPSAGRVTVAGTLSVRGRPRRMALDATASFDHGHDEFLLDAEARIDRGDFEMTWGRRMGVGMVTTVAVHLVFTPAAPMEGVA
jgi:polyisoprenoid-binding protein YceI